ncbi:polymorphic toxin-type HINT domain-containing protein [Actinoplanes sp. CA-015351]|uniref:polymorphic toxin-type HINT domain-containing protein n=1 Tax=Actinoplanes sp. CA-015351 TaxID=3239897 RepID=UPI003D99BCA7
MGLSFRSGLAVVTATTVLGTLAVEPQPAAAMPARAPAAAATAGDLRARAMTAWRSGGPEVQAAAERALLGTDADLAVFVDTEGEPRQATDERLAITRMISGGGPSVRQAGQQALASTDPDAIGEFLEVGWEQAEAVDQRIRVSQVMDAGGAQVKAAGQAALTNGTPRALDTFIESGWQKPYEVDQRVRIVQILTGAGAEVRRLAQRALQTGTIDAYAQFIEVEWAVGAARDQETKAITDLAGAATAAAEEAAAQTVVATEQAQRAAASAEAARKAAELAKAAVQRAQSDAIEAAAAARQAADAAENAAKAAREAISAANAATRAAQVAASAAARAASAATLTQRAASRAQQAAANAATDATKAGTARDAAVAARNAAQTAKKAADAAGKAGDVARQAQSAARSAGSAGAQAVLAVQAANEAVALAQRTGVNTSQAVAAANRARANAERANRAAAASATFAGQAADAAHRSRDAALSAVVAATAAAAAADEAAAHAGEAAQAAARSTAAANAATTAANQAVTAAEQAHQIYDQARAAEAERLAVALAEGRAAAAEAVQALDRYEQKAAADSQEATKRGAEVDALIATANNPATPRTEAVPAARKVALALTRAQGTWTSKAAMDAFAGSDDVVLAFVRDGIDRTAAQDDRVMVASLAAEGSEAFAAAAETALTGTDAQVAVFLQEQDYPQRAQEDRLAVTRVLTAAQDAGDTVLAQRAQQVLAAGTATVSRRFLTVEQFDLAAIGDRVRATQLLEDDASGPEVRAAARIALENTPAALRNFLDQGQHDARQADQEAAAHEGQILALLAQADTAATTATQQAQEAQAVAATARGSAAEAARYASQAQASAQTAAGYAAQAIASADRAQQSADRAAASAKTAAQAAATATAAANRAARSAAWAQDSYRRAGYWAEQAYESAVAARKSAIAAGKSAQEAIDAYNTAYDAAVSLAEDERRAENARQALICQAENIPGTEAYQNCKYHVTDSDSAKFGKAMVNAEMCHLLAAPGSIYHKNCLYDTFNPNFGLNRQMDFAQLYSQMMLSFAIGTAAVLAVFLTAVACSELCGTALAIMGGAEALMGVGGFVDLWLTSQLVNVAAGVTASTRALIEIKALSGLRIPAIFQRVTVRNQADKALLGRYTLGLRRCLTGNSFTSDTPVLLAEGGSRPIGQVREGDQILATDPLTGISGPQTVTRTISGTGEKDLVEITVDGGTVIATANHPFWVAGPDRWVTAGKLQDGHLLRTSAGTWVQIAASDRDRTTATVHNLTVAGTHTFYVLAGNTPVLVHNTGGCPISGFKTGISADEVDDINRSFGGDFLVNGSFDNTLINVGRYNSFWDKLAVVIRDIAGGHMYDNGNKRTAQAVAEQLLQRNNIVSGPTSAELRDVIDRVGKGQLSSVEDISAALRGF